MTREHTVAVRVKGGGAVTHCAGDRYAIACKGGETKSTWANGSPITKADFEAVLAPTGLFEIVVPEHKTHNSSAHQNPAEKKGA